jgi:hypothetical protein
MRKLVKVFGILLVIVAITGVGQAIKPNPVPPDSADPFGALWAAIQDLQSQINALVTQVANIPGPVHYGERQIIYPGILDDFYPFTAETDGIITVTVRHSGEVSVNGALLANPPMSVADQGFGKASISLPLRQGEMFQAEWSNPGIGNGGDVMVMWTPLVV